MSTDDGSKGADEPFQLFKPGGPIKNPTTHWTKEAQKHLLGRRITEVRYLFEDESKALGWYARSVVLVLDNGALFFPSSDDEGNGPGALFGQGADGAEITLPVLSR